MKINIRTSILTMLIVLSLTPILAIISITYIPNQIIKETTTGNSVMPDIEIDQAGKNIEKVDHMTMNYTKNSSIIDEKLNYKNINQNPNIVDTVSADTQIYKTSVEKDISSNHDNQNRTKSITDNIASIEPEYPNNVDEYSLEQDEILQFKASPIPYFGYTFNIEINGTMVVRNSQSQVPGYGIGDPPICFDNYCYYWLYHPEFERGWHEIKITNVEFGLEIEYDFLVVNRFIEYSYPDPSKSFIEGQEISIYNTIQNKYDPEARDIKIKSEFSDNVEIVRAVIYRDGWINCEIQDQTVYADIGDLSGYPTTDVLGVKDCLYITIIPNNDENITNKVEVTSSRYSNYWGYYTNHKVIHNYEYEVEN